MPAGDRYQPTTYNHNRPAAKCRKQLPSQLQNQCFAASAKCDLLSRSNYSEISKGSDAGRPIRWLNILIATGRRASGRAIAAGNSSVGDPQEATKMQKVGNNRNWMAWWIA
ncbi:MAG TPA: hypothetical protein VHY20_13235, partial [Pirellulales bacterium]|nr:hypothetical protein [Pirellulales bacterium]